MRLATYIGAIRDRIENGRLRRSLLADASSWNVLCSALDVVEDTELALDSYLTVSITEDLGARYLLVYGALQALHAQQDAVAAICTALRIRPRTPPNIASIRIVRGDAIGHPMSRRENKDVRSSFVVRTSLSPQGFDLHTVSAAGPRYEQRHVNIPSFVKDQREVLAASLEEVVREMDENENAHRAKHRDEKLGDIFGSVLPYYMEKVFEGIRRPLYGELGRGCLRLVADAVEKFRTRLSERGEWSTESAAALTYEDLTYPTDELSQYLADPNSSRLNEKDAIIFATYIRLQLEGLEQIAAQIDERYAGPPEV